MSLLDRELAERALARALGRGGAFADVYVEERSGFAVSLDDRRVERPQTGRERGVSVRVVAGDATYFGHVDGLDEADLLRVADSVAGAVSAESRTPRTLAAETEAASAHEVRERPEQAGAARKAELLRACDEHARGAGTEVTQVTASYAETRRVVEVFNSEGRAATDDRTRVRLGVQVVARRDGTVETGHETRGGHAGFELVADAPEEVADRAARKALTMLEAGDAPTGRMPVVVGNGFGGVLLHEAVGHGLEADAVQKRASVYAGRIGDRLAEPFVSAFDDGRKPGEWGSDGIDDEGTPTRRTPILEDGRLSSYLYDLVRARRDGAESTGNGRRESFRHLPVPRMTNTYFAPGGASPEGLIEGTKRGLYAVSFGGGQVEPATGDFVFGVSEGYLIEDGRVTAPVRGATLIGNGVEALGAIDGVAGDLRIATGFCGKAGQRVAAGVGQPHVRIRALTVGGTAG
ncbi:MAG TPA: TldD/PmbA family protein [Thermoleophilaceae bacterium]|nr:TldD/PmbA family protein [Thermoleophilaceae bacterium]